jgi:hypothetical protein
MYDSAFSVCPLNMVYLIKLFSNHDKTHRPEPSISLLDGSKMRVELT